MHGLVILRAISGFLALFSVPSLICAIWAFYNDRYQQASLFIIVVTTSIVVSVVFAIATHHRRKDTAQAKDVVGFLLAVWFLLAVLGGLPFYEVAGGKPFLALFEAVSCATTTGASLLPEDVTLPASLFAWRAILHVFGAILSVCGVILVINLVGASLPGLNASLPVRFNIEFSREGFMKIFVMIGSLIMGLIAFFTVFPMIDGASLREAVGLSVGAVTTGQVFDVAESNFAIGRLTYLSMTLAMICGSVNIVLLFNVARKPGAFFSNAEVISLLIMIGALTAALLIAHSGPESFLELLAWATSIVSTSGVLLDEQQSSIIEIPILLVFGFIGGAAISATGGMKIYRMLVLLSRSVQEFEHLAHPHAVRRVENLKERFPVRFVLTIWAYLIAFAAISMGLAACLALSGANFGEALSTSMGAITNSAALLKTGWMGGADYEALVQGVLSAFMILGRLELLLLLSWFLGD